MAQEHDWSSVGSTVEASTHDWSSVGDAVDANGKPKPEKSGAIRRLVADTLVTGIKASIGLPEAVVGIADLATAGYAGKLAESAGFRPKEAKSILDDFYSPEQKAANKYVNEADGFVETIKRGIETPSVIAHSIGESIPQMLGGAGLARQALKAAPKVGAMVAGAVGEGVIGAGSAAEQLRQGTDDGTLDAQRIGGALASGAGTAAFGMLGGKLSQKIGLSDIDTALAGGSRAATSAGLPKRIIGGAVSEGVLEEMPQSAWEQAAQNYATDKPLDEGVGKAAGLGLLTGGVMGGVFNALPGSKYVENKRQPPAEEQPAIAGLLPAPTYTGTPGEQIVTADAERQAAIDAADANAAAIYAARDAFERGLRQAVTITNEPAPLQQRIDELLNVDASRLSKAERADYEKSLAASFNEPIGVRHDERQREVPFTMGEYLDAQVSAENAVRARPMKQNAMQQSGARLQQVADEESAQQPDIALPTIPVVGPLSAAANLAVQSGAHAAAVQQAQNTQPAGQAGMPAGAQSITSAPASGPLTAAAGAVAPQQNAPQAGAPAAAAQAAGQGQVIDLSKRTDAQLNYLTQHGKDGHKEAAIAELAKRNGDGVTNQPEAAPGQSAQQQPAKGAENGQAETEVLKQSGAVSNAAPAEDSIGWTRMTTVEREGLLIRAGYGGKGARRLNLGGAGALNRAWENMGQGIRDKLTAAHEAQFNQEPIKNETPSAATVASEPAGRNQEPIKKESAIDAALRSVGIDPSAPVSKAGALRKQAEQLMRESNKMLDGIPAGQPILSTRDRNLREKSMDKARKAGDLYRQADEMDKESAKAAGIDAQLAAVDAESQPKTDVAPEARKGIRTIDRWTPAELQARIDKGNLSPESEKRIRAELASRKPSVVAQEPELSVGKTPNSAEPITVRDGVIYLGKYPAADFETGEDVTVKDGATKQQIVESLRKSGAIGQAKVFGLKNDSAPSLTAAQPPATHIENGKAEPATAAVVADSLKKGAANSPLDLRQERDLLLKKVDAAIAEAPTAEEKGAWDRINKKIDLTNSTNVEDYIGYRGFDVPGDGKFKVLNIKEALQRFRERVESNPGFRKPTNDKPKTVADWQKTGRGGSEATIKELLEQGEYTAAHEYAKQIDKPLIIGQYQNGSTITAYTDAKPFEREGYDDFNMVSARAFGASDKTAWSVICLDGGLAVSINEPTRMKAIGEANKALSKMTPEQLANAVKSAKANSPSIAGTQAELEQRFLDWAEKTEAEAQTKTEQEHRKQLRSHRGMLADHTGKPVEESGKTAAQKAVTTDAEFDAKAKWESMTPSQRFAMLDTFSGSGLTDMGSRYKDRSWDSFNVGEQSTLRAVLQSPVDAAPKESTATVNAGKQEEAKPVEKADQSDEEAIAKLAKRSVDWLRKEGGESVPVRDAIKALVLKQKLITEDTANWTPRDGDGHPLVGVWLYKTDARAKLDDIGWAITNLLAHIKKHGDQLPEVPEVKQKADQVPLSSVIDKVNATNGEGLTEADRVPVTPDSLVDQHNASISKLHDGELSVNELKAAFARVRDNRTAIEAELSKFKKDELLRSGGPMFGYRNKSETKPKIVTAAYAAMLDDFILGDSISYPIGGRGDWVDSKIPAIQARVDAATPESLAAYAEKIKANRAEREQRREELTKAMKDPQTLEDYRRLIQAKTDSGKTLEAARMELTAEQRIRYDTLAAEAVRSQRGQRNDASKTEVRVAAQTTSGDIIETKHTKTGADLFVVKAAERVERDVYNQWNAAAKKLGGWYSSFRGNGAVPGFQFKTRDDANAFLQYLGGDATAAQQVVKEKHDTFADDRSQSAVERLNDMADRLDERADESLGRERKANTERRARFAASAEAAANGDKALAKTMRNIAKAIDAGTAKFLDRVRQKAQVEMLRGAVSGAQYAELQKKYPAYVEQERHRGEAPTAETADYARWPSFTAYRSDLAILGRELLQIDGAKKLGQALLKVADDVGGAYEKFAKDNLHKVSVFSAKREDSDESRPAVFSTAEKAEAVIAKSGYKGKATVISFKRGEHQVIMGPTMAREAGVWAGDDDKRITLKAEFAEEIVAKNKTMGKRNRLTMPYVFDNVSQERARWKGLGIESAVEMRAALREFIALREAPAEADKIKSMERAMIGRKNDGLDFFPTPAATAQAMIEAADISDGMSVLEPSAGMGHIAEQIRDVAGIDPDVIEFGSDRRELLEAKGFRVIANDFLDLTPRSFTFGDVFRAPDGTVGVMRGSGGLGSNRVGLQPLDDSGNPDARRSQWVDRDSLEEVEKRGLESGYDRILMNPPFSNRRDAEHVQHAYTLLKPGGRLVAIMGEGVFFGQDKKAVAFREWFDEVGGTSEKLEEGTFLDPSLPVNTATNARMVVIDKPAGQVAPSDNDGAGNIASQGSITAADKAVYGMASEGKSAAEILKFISSASRNPFYRQLAKLLMNTGVAPSITVGDARGWKFNAGEGNKYAAAYNPKTDTVALFRPAAAERNTLHELVHAATLKALSKKGMAAGQMTVLFKHVKKGGALKGMYGMSDIDEFVAEAFTNPHFQQRLKAVAAPQQAGTLKSAWHWFVRIVRGILGIPQGQENALSQALEIGLGVMREDVALRTAPKSVMVDGVMRPTMNANGNPIHYTEDGIRNFWRWMDGTNRQRLEGKAGQGADQRGIHQPAERNPVVAKYFFDGRGQPRVFFHGTSSSVDSFDLDHEGRLDQGWLGRGVYLSGDPELANSYANIKSGKENPNVMPLYVAIHNPLEATLAVKEAFRKRNKAWIDAWTKRVMDAGHDGVVLDLGNDFLEVVAFNPKAVKSASGNVGQFDSGNSDIRYNVADEGWSVSEPSKLDDVIYALQDKHIDTRRVMQSIMKTGKKIKDEFNAYLQEELFHGRAAKGVKDFLDFELRPLLKQMQDSGIDMGDFEEYLWNRHAEERNKQIAKVNPDMPDGGSGIETATARAYLAGLTADQRKTFAALAAKVEAMNMASQRVLVESGLEKQSTIDAWNGAYRHYVPLQREDVDTGHVGTGKGFSVRGSSTKRAMGSGRKVIDIIANLTMQRERNIVRAEKNRVSNALLGLAVQNPNPEFWKVDQAPKERVVEEKAIYTVTDSAGNKIDEFTRMDDAERLAKKTPGATIDQTWGDRVSERVVPGFQSKDHVLLTRVNGEDHYIIFNERDERAMRMAAAMKNLDMDNLGRVLSIVGKATRYLASINTQYNPVFGVINLIRDAQGALINLASTPLAGDQKRVLGYTVDALRGIYSDIRAHRKGEKPSSKWAALFEEFQKEGGQTGYRDQFANAEQRAEAIKAELEQFKDGKVKQLTRGLFGWLSDYNETMENAVRLAAYKAATEKGMSKQQAASLAKNITVNFNRKGQMATQVGALYAFFNASVQGTARIAETLFEQSDGNIKTARLSKAGKKIIYGGILLGSMQALLLAAAGYDDDDPPDFVRERNLILPIGDGKYLTLAMPLGFHVIPGIGRIATEFVMSGGKDPLKRIAAFGSMFAESFNPIGSSGFSLQTITPSVVDPFAALAENRDFTGKEIYRKDFNALNPTPGHARAKDVATVWSRYISEALNFMTGGTEFKPGLFSPSPDSIDYLLGQLTGGVGREVNKAFQTGSAASTGEDLPIYKIPLLGRFVGDTEGQGSQSAKFYDAIKQINMHEAEYKGLLKDGRRQEATEYMTENPAVRLIMAGNHAESSIRKLRTMKRDLVEKDADQDQVRAIDERITATMKAFNKRAGAVI